MSCSCGRFLNISKPKVVKCNDKGVSTLYEYCSVY